MRFGHRFSIENGGTESSCKRIACAHCVGNRYFGRLLERDNARCEHIAAIDAASENQHLQVVFCQQNPAFILQINAGITKHTADSHQLFVVYLQDVATVERFAQYLFRVEILAEIDIKYLELSVYICLLYTSPSPRD